MITRVACVLLAASAFVLLGTVPALAAKETFVRAKPHVNVGTVGTMTPGDSITTTVSLLGLGHLAGEIRDERPCSAVFDVRYIHLGDPAAPPLAEQLGMRGAVSVRDLADGRTTRVLAVKPEDFISYDLSQGDQPLR